MNIKQLLSARRSGVFRFDIAKINLGTLPVLEGITRACVEGRTVRDKTTFLKQTAEALHFPQYFGHNWDAAYDCITDISERFGVGLLLSFDDLSEFARADPEEFAAAMGVLVDATQYWAQSGNCLLVLIGLDQPMLASGLEDVSLG